MRSYCVLIQFGTVRSYHKRRKADNGWLHSLIGWKRCIHWNWRSSRNTVRPANDSWTRSHIVQDRKTWTQNWLTWKSKPPSIDRWSYSTRARSMVTVGHVSGYVNRRTHLLAGVIWMSARLQWSPVISLGIRRVLYISWHQRSACRKIPEKLNHSRTNGMVSEQCKLLNFPNQAKGYIGRTR